MSFDSVATEEVKGSANLITLMDSWISQAPMGLFDLHRFIQTNVCSLVLLGLHPPDYHFISTRPINPGKQKCSLSKALIDWSVCHEKVVVIQQTKENLTSPTVFELTAGVRCAICRGCLLELSILWYQGT